MEKSEPNETKSLIILFPQASQNTYLQTLKGQLAGDESLRIEEANSIKDVSQLVQQFGSALVIFCIRHKEDLSIVLGGLGEWNSYIKGKFLRAIGVTQLDHPQIPPTLMKRGCADLFSPGLNAKSLKHKINQSLKILETYRIQSGGAKPPPLSGSKDQPTARPKEPLQEKPQQVTWTKAPALTLASDVWLMRNERDVRTVQGRWIIDMTGPGPSTGYWDESPSEKQVWFWKHKITEDSKTFITDQGQWIFRGRKPEFVNDQGCWRFIGEAPDLSFVDGEQVRAIRFKLSKQGGEIADNSAQARAKLPAIARSIEHEVRFTKEKPKVATDPNVHDLSKDKRPEIGEGYALKDEVEATEIQDRRGEDQERASTDPNVHDLSKEKPEVTSDGFALKGEIEATPFNQAPKPKLKITVQAAQTGGGRPLIATPIELDDDVLVLEVLAGQFGAEQGVIIVMDDGLHTPHSKRRLRATVKEILGTEGEAEQISIKIDPELRVSFAPVQTALKERQEEIFNFLKAARGW